MELFTSFPNANSKKEIWNPIYSLHEVDSTTIQVEFITQLIDTITINKQSTLKTREGFKYKLFLNLFNRLDQLQMILTNKLQTYVLFQLANEQNYQHSIKTVLKNKNITLLTTKHTILKCKGLVLKVGPALNTCQS